MNKKIISIFVSIFILGNSTNFGNKVLAEPKAAEDKFINSYIEPTIKVTKNKKNGLIKSSLLPSKYDLREQNLVTDIKDQGELGTCWAFAAVASMESNILKNEGKYEDFSEINMALNHGFNYGVNDGGNYQMAAAYLARWGGPVSEVNDPYPDPPVESGVVNRGSFTPEKHIQEVIFLPDRESSLDNSSIKQAILDYGAIMSSMHIEQSLVKSNGAYYNNLYTGANHGITIVGWDDNYSKNNFLTAPPGDGAFICKNSWGTYFGDGGYLYISYYDLEAFKNNAAFTDAEPINNYNNIYQYDPLGIGSVYSYGNTVWEANAFTAEDNGTNNENLTAVSFYTYNENTSYEIYAETNYDTNGLNNIKNNLVSSGTLADAGYHTIKLNSKCKLSDNKKFAVEVKLYNPDKAWFFTENNNFEDADTIVGNPGESFVSNDGNNFIDSFSEFGGNLCIKAFTNIDYTNPVTGISLNRESLYMQPGEDYKLTADVQPENAINKSVLWESSDERIAGIDDNGTIHGVKPGTAVITAASFDGNFKGSMTVNIADGFSMINSNIDNNYLSMPGSDIKFTFTGDLISDTGYEGILLKDENERTINCGISSNENNLVINPDENLLPGKVYSLYIPKELIKDKSNNFLSEDIKKSFLVKLPTSDNVSFNSPNLEKAVREQLNILAGNITSSDMEKITSLTISSSNINDLKGLEYCINLKSLNLPECNIADISRLKNLRNLENVNLDNNKISDLTPLNNIYSIKSLSLNDNCILDIKPIESLINIGVLSIDNNVIRDLYSLKLISENIKSNNSMEKSVSAFGNYINTNDSSVINDLNYIASNLLYFNYENQKKGIPVLYTEPMEGSGGFEIYDYLKLRFLNNLSTINGSEDLDKIELYCYNSDKKISAAKGTNISSNVLSIVPDIGLSNNTEYVLHIPQNVLKDSEGNLFTEDYYLTFTTSDFIGDINKDGTADLLDIAAAAQNYGTNALSSSYIEDIDINKDGIIGIFDLVKLSKYMN